MNKAEALQHWRLIPQLQEITPHPIPYKHAGSTFGEDQIRITGSLNFISQVLSNLKPLLEYEATGTRLALNLQPCKDRATKELLDPPAFSCYIAVHERGPEAQVMGQILAGLKAMPEGSVRE